MKSQHISMTLDEFHLLPRKLGWKYEYWDGQTHISPQLSAVVTTAMPIAPRAVAAPCEIRPLCEDDLPALVPAYCAAFRDTIEYCDWSFKMVESAARENLQRYFSGNRGKPLTASHVAVSAGQIVGAAFINEPSAQKPLLYLLLVVPDWHRHGVANAIVAAALNWLSDLAMPSLTSRFVLGNEASRAWHHRFGFVDKVDQYLARAYYYHTDDRIARHEKIGDLTESELAALTVERDDWRERLHELEKQSAIKIAAVEPEG